MAAVLGRHGLPRPSVGRVGVPAIAFWGEHEDTVPREASQQIWRDADIEAQIVDIRGLRSLAPARQRTSWLAGVGC